MCVSVAILLNHFAISPASAIVSPQSCKYEVQTCTAKLEKFQHAYKLHIRGVLCVLYSVQLTATAEQQSLRETDLPISKQLLYK